MKLVYFLAPAALYMAACASAAPTMGVFRYIELGNADVRAAETAPEINSECFSARGLSGETVVPRGVNVPRSRGILNDLMLEKEINDSSFVGLRNFTLSTVFCLQLTGEAVQ